MRWQGQAGPFELPQRPTTKRKREHIERVGGGGESCCICASTMRTKKKKTNYISFLLFCFLHTGQQQLSLILFCQVIWPRLVGPFMSGLPFGRADPELWLLRLAHQTIHKSKHSNQTDRLFSSHSCCVMVVVDFCFNLHSTTCVASSSHSSQVPITLGTRSMHPSSLPVRKKPKKKRSLIFNALQSLFEYKHFVVEPGHTTSTGSHTRLVATLAQPPSWLIVLVHRGFLGALTDIEREKHITIKTTLDVSFLVSLLLDSLTLSFHRNEETFNVKAKGCMLPIRFWMGFAQLHFFCFSPFFNVVCCLHH